MNDEIIKSLKWDNEQKNFLFYMLEEMEAKMSSRDLSDDYLEEHKNSTREEIGIGEYAYGITMIPCSWVYPYLVKLSTYIDMKDK
jgi:hypothetical protein